MKIEQHCPICVNKKFDRTGQPIVSVKISHFVLNDSGIQPITCENGHDYAVVFDSAKFETLFDVGMRALADGYVREAVSSFAASLERFYEFYLGYMSDVQQLPQAVFESSWKKISNQSERQLGAFIFVYAFFTKNAPPILSNNEVSFRNKVIHKGYIPKTDEAEKFGKAIYDSIMQVLGELEQKDPDSLLSYHHRQCPQSSGFNWTVRQSANAINIRRKRKGSSNFGFEHVKKFFP